MGKQTFIVDTFCDRPRVTFNEKDHVCHWKACLKGWMRGDVVINPSGSVSLDIEEVPYTTNHKKRIMVDLDPEVFEAIIEAYQKMKAARAIADKVSPV